MIVGERILLEGGVMLELIHLLHELIHLIVKIQLVDGLGTISYGTQETFVLVYGNSTVEWGLLDLILHSIYAAFLKIFLGNFRKDFLGYFVLCTVNLL